MDACLACFHSECQPAKVCPRGPHPSCFVKPQWRRPVSDVPYLLYRTVVAILIPIWVGFDYWLETKHFFLPSYWMWFIYATNWSFMFLGVLAISQLFICLWYRRKTWDVKESERDDDRRLPISMTLHWILYNMVANSALVICFSYWFYLVSLDHAEYLSTKMSRLKHSLTAIYILTDMMIIGMPIRIFHVIYAAIGVAVYVIFNASYFLNDGKGPDGQDYAYYVLSWHQPAKATVVMILEFLLAVLVQFILFGWYKLRMFLYRKVYPDVVAGDGTSMVDHSGERANILGGQEQGYKSLEDGRAEDPLSPYDS